MGFRATSRIQFKPKRRGPWTWKEWTDCCKILPHWSKTLSQYGQTRIRQARSLRLIIGNWTAFKCILIPDSYLDGIKLYWPSESANFAHYQQIKRESFVRMESILFWKGIETKKGTSLSATPGRGGWTIDASKRSHQFFLKERIRRKRCGRWFFLRRIVRSQIISGKKKKKSRTFFGEKIPNYQESHWGRSFPLPRLNFQDLTFSWRNLAKLWNNNHCYFYACDCQYLRLHVLL